MERDIRTDWFMQQHFGEDELDQLFAWEEQAGKIANVVPVENAFALHHVKDKEKKIVLCIMKEEHMLRRWAERLGYTISDGKTAKEFEKEKGIKDKIVVGKEVWRKGKTSLTSYGAKKLTITSGDYAIVAKRTASNAYEILLLDSKEYDLYLNDYIREVNAKNKTD